MSETASDLFGILPPALFRPLGDPYARVYFGMLAALYEAKFEGAPVELPKGVAMAIAEDVLRSSREWSDKRVDLIASVADEDVSDEDARAEDDEAVRATSARLLRRLERTGWFRFEYYPEVGEVLNFHAYPARLVGLLRSIAKDEQPILSGFAHAVASMLREDRFETRPGLHLDMAERETVAFSRELRILHGTIQDSLERFVAHDLSVPEIIDETIHRYADRVRHSYNNLKTRENIFGWRAYVMRRLAEISERPALREHAARELCEIRQITPEHAADLVEERLATMQSHIDALPRLVSEIDQRNQRYSGLASRRVAYLLRQNESFDAQLQYLIDSMGSGTIGFLDLPLYRQQHISGESWYRPRRHAPAAQARTALLPDEDVPEAVVREQMASALAKPFRPERVAAWADDLFGDRTSIQIADVAINDDECYVYLIQLIHYAESAKVPFSVSIPICVVPHCTGCDGCRTVNGRYSFPRGLIMRGAL